MKKKLAYIGTALSLPFFAFAQIQADNAGNLVTSIISFINNYLVPFVFAAAFIVFIWGIFQYFILGGHDEEKRDQGKQLMLYGIIGIFLMVSVWGLVHLLTGSVQLNNTETLPTQLQGAGAH